MATVLFRIAPVLAANRQWRNGSPSHRRQPARRRRYMRIDPSEGGSGGGSDRSAGLGVGVDCSDGMAAPSSRRRGLKDEFSPRACAALVAAADLVTAVVMWSRLLLAAEDGRWARGHDHDPFEDAHLPPRWQIQAFLAWLFLLQTPVPVLLFRAALKERLQSAELWLKLSLMLPLLLMADLLVTVSACVADHQFNLPECVLVAILGLNLCRAQLSRCLVTRYCRSLHSSLSLSMRLQPQAAAGAAAGAVGRALTRANAVRRPSAHRAHSPHSPARDPAAPERLAHAHAPQPPHPQTAAPPPLPSTDPPPAAAAAGYSSSPPSYSTLFPDGPPKPPPLPPPPPPPPPPFPPPPA